MTTHNWTCEIVNLIYLQQNWIDNVMADQFKIRPTQQMSYVGFLAREKIIEADDIVSILNETLTQMGTQKPCTASNQNPFDHFHLLSNKTGNPPHQRSKRHDDRQTRS